MSALSKVFDSLNITLYAADVRESILPVRFSGLEVQKNFLIQLIKGHYYNEDERLPMQVGSYYFRPAGSIVDMRIGKASDYLTFTKEEGMPTEEQRTTFQRILSPYEDVSYKQEVFSYIVFDVLLFGAIPFFKILQLPRIPLPPDKDMAFLISEICRENYEDSIGKKRLLNNYAEEIVIRILRYIYTLPEYKQNFEKIEFLTDKRLADIITYIQDNISEELSNTQLAKIAFLSEDYIGQYFKSLTNLNLQEYVESQRLQIALHKLNTTTDSVQQIAFSVGFKDPAYFSRRFKMKYNVNANAIRNSKSTLH